MNRIASRTAALALLAATSLAPSGTAPADDLPRRNSEIARPPMPKKDTIDLWYGGTVKELTKDKIAILWPGEEKPKPFLVSDTLAAGAYPRITRVRLDSPLPPDWVPFAYRYRLTDVKVGDQVSILYAHLGDADICDAVSIRKRPGGRIPPLPEGAEPLKSPSGGDLILYHEQLNAYWDLEEKGIPYPEKFGSGRRFPVAPMPREVKPGPAIAP